MRVAGPIPQGVLETCLHDEYGFPPYVLREPRGVWGEARESWKASRGGRERASSRGGGELPARIKASLAQFIL